MIRGIIWGDKNFSKGERLPVNAVIVEAGNFLHPYGKNFSKGERLPANTEYCCSRQLFFLPISEQKSPGSVINTGNKQNLSVRFFHRNRVICQPNPVFYHLLSPIVPLLIFVMVFYHIIGLQINPAERRKMYFDCDRAIHAPQHNKH